MIRCVARRAVLAPLLVLAGCAGADASSRTVERVDSAGVEIVRNPGRDVPLAWSFTPVRTIGGRDAGPEAFSRLHRGSVGVDSAGNVYVLDHEAHHVAVFGPDGRFLRTQGRKGGGPGEFAWAEALGVSPDGTVSLFDFGKASLVHWGPRGEVMPTRPLAVFLYDRIAPMEDALVAVVPRQETATAPIVDELMRMREGDTVRLATLRAPTPRSVDFGCAGLQQPAVFSPKLAWDARDGTVAVASGADYRVAVHRRDGRISSIRRDLSARPVTREMALAEVGKEQTITYEGDAAPACRISPERWVDGFGHTDVLPAVEELALAPGGEIWVRRGYVKGEDAVQDVFSSDGEYLGTLPPGSPVPAAFTPAGELIAIELDDVDVPRLVFYRIGRGAPDA